MENRVGRGLRDPLVLKEFRVQKMIPVLNNQKVIPVLNNQKVIPLLRV